MVGCEERPGLLTPYEDCTMKPWLLNILACPICKEHPLTIHVLQVDKIKLADSKELANELMVHYKKGVLSEPSLGPVHNLSGNKDFDQKLDAARKAFSVFSQQKPSPTALKPLVEYFHGLEIISGTLRCEKCQRWYPIGSRISSVPELLPDTERKRKPDTSFLRKYQNVLPESILTGSKPFSIKPEA
ncbi:MAG: Trm112 family protein [Promethearchaeota archaeon]